MELTSLLNAIFTVTPLLPYIPQYRLMEATKNSGGFSPWVCLIIMTGSILRVAFWIGKRFDVFLLIQSLLMILGQLVMLELSVRLRPKQLDVRTRTLANGHIDDFWKWDDFGSYLTFIGAFLAFWVLTGTVAASSPLLVEGIGALALSIEACLGVPQFLQNRATGNVIGVSRILIGSWFAGDAFKTVYFLYTDAPTQFVACGMAQLVVDVAILVQFYSASQRRKTGEKREL
mmetsp:Transcript_2739/g.8810  ORF Transcript_2739/g.8810 Transcript_2739/m.8810 type:complete len:231 (-) Transcript_2739:376-1068(-)